MLGDNKHLVKFADDEGWTPLHYASYHEFDSILYAIIDAQKDVGYEFAYGDLVSTPFHVAVENGYTSTLIQLMELWPDARVFCIHIYQQKWSKHTTHGGKSKPKRADTRCFEMLSRKV